MKARTFGMGLVAGTFAVCASLAVADAADAKTATGSTCYPMSASSTSWSRIPAGGRNTSTTQSVLVVCPLIRDNTTNTTGLSGAALNVGVPAGQSMTCTLGAYATNGFGTIKTVAKTTPASGISKLDWGTELNLSTSLGTYAIDCTVPPGGSIYSLHYTEF